MADAIENLGWTIERREMSGGILITARHDKRFVEAFAGDGVTDEQALTVIHDEIMRKRG